MMQSKHLHFEPLETAHAEELLPILTTPAVLAFISPTEDPPTLQELEKEYSARARGSTNPNERWFNMLIRLKIPPSVALGRLEATAYAGWGEVAYLLGEPWWGKGLAFEALQWWHAYLADAAPETQWWAAVHPDNQRSIRLLKRLGYVEVDPQERPPLGSYDAGDACFTRL